MYKNYGDRNFFEYGLLVDAEHSDTEFSILYCMPYCDEEDKYFFADCTVDINDNWINRELILMTCGMSEGKFDPVEFACACVFVYGAENFSSPYNGYTFTRKEIEERLKYYMIASDNLDVTW